MPGGNARFIRQLENASRRASIMPPDEVAALFRRAVLRLNNIESFVIDQDLDQALTDIAGERQKPKLELIENILNEWLSHNARTPAAQPPKEDGEAE